MGKVEGLFAGETTSPSEVLAELMGRVDDGEVESVLVVVIHPNKELDVVYSTLKVPELALASKFLDAYVGDVLRDVMPVLGADKRITYSDPEDEPEEPT